LEIPVVHEPSLAAHLHAAVGALGKEAGHVARAADDRQVGKLKVARKLRKRL
jgi:hypothetical protein